MKLILDYSTCSSAIWALSSDNTGVLGSDLVFPEQVFAAVKAESVLAVCLRNGSWEENWLNHEVETDCTVLVDVE